MGHNDFGENQAYEYARFLLWEKRHDLGDIELLVRFNFEQVRATNRPYTLDWFLSKCEEWELNHDIVNCFEEKESILVLEDKGCFDKLHNALGGWQWKNASFVKSWRTGVIDTMPDNLFGGHKTCRKAYDTLLEYQNNRETNNKTDTNIEEWARPSYGGPFLSSTAYKTM